MGSTVNYGPNVTETCRVSNLYSLWNLKWDGWNVYSFDSESHRDPSKICMGDTVRDNGGLGKREQVEVISPTFSM